MKTLVVIGIGLVVIITIIVMVLMEILELAFGIIFVLAAIILFIWLYNKVKDKID